MRIENQTIGSVGGGNSTDSLRSVNGASHINSANSQDFSSDTVSLSSASGLINLAKSLHSQDRQSRISSLAAQVRSGSYQVNAGALSKAIIGNFGS